MAIVVWLILSKPDKLEREELLAKYMFPLAAPIEVTPDNPVRFVSNGFKNTTMSLPKEVSVFNP